MTGEKNKDQNSTEDNKKIAEEKKVDKKIVEGKNIIENKTKNDSKKTPDPSTPKMQTKKKIDITCQLITCVSENSEEAIERAKKTVAFYISVGDIYRKFLAKNGFQNETSNIFEEFKKSGFKSNHELVTDSMLQSLAISGTPEECKKQLASFVDVGIDQPILQFNPIGETMDSFKLFKKTFLDE